MSDELGSALMTTVGGVLLGSVVSDSAGFAAVQLAVPIVDGRWGRWWAVWVCWSRSVRGKRRVRVVVSTNRSQNASLGV